MNRTTLAAAALVTTMAFVHLAPADSATYMPSDTPVEINGYELACTGIGDEAQSDPRWKAFPVRMEFAGGNAQYLADVEASVFDTAGNELFRVRCDSPWLLAKLPNAKYRVQGTFRNITKSANFVAPKQGQARIIVRFPEIVGNGDN